MARHDQAVADQRQQTEQGNGPAPESQAKRADLAVDGTGDDKVGRPQQHGQHQQDIGRAREEAIRVMMMSTMENAVDSTQALKHINSNLYKIILINF
jgi:hypothetical protein